MSSSPSPKSAPIHIVQVSDSHLGDTDEWNTRFAEATPLSTARSLVHAVNKLPFEPDFVVHTGDVVADPSEAAYQRARDVFGALAYPTFWIPGNHDDSELLGRYLPSPVEGGRSYYSFDSQGIRFVFLDSTLGAKSEVRGGLDDGQLAWASSQLDGEFDSVVVFVHHNVIAMGNEWLDGYMGLSNGERLHELLVQSRSRVLGVFFGHVHQNLQVVRDGIFYASASSSWTQFSSWPGQTRTAFDPLDPPGFNVISVRQGLISVSQCRIVEP